jgi:hypothetical protein
MHAKGLPGKAVQWESRELEDGGGVSFYIRRSLGSLVLSIHSCVCFCDYNI